MTDVDPAQPVWSFVQKLQQATREGRVPWVPESPTEFRLTTENGGIFLRSKDGDGNAPFLLTIRNSEGTAIEEYESHTDTTTGSWDDTLEELYETVRRRALGIDEVIEGIADELQLDPPPPKEDDIPF